MKKYKVLNLYAGLGGNRKLWENVEVTSIEYNPDIANVYKALYPKDTIIVTDAHEYLLNHWEEDWDLIWTSPPCPSHSRIRNIAGVGRRQNEPIYPDMKLYEEIIFLQQIFNSKGCKFNGKYVVENVIPYYKPLIEPQIIHRHCIWSNFPITYVEFEKEKIHSSQVPDLEKHHGIDLSNFNITNKRQILRNCVYPPLGLHIFNEAFKDINANIDSSN